MPFLGPIIRVGKIIYDATTLPKRIEGLDQELQKPLTSYFQGVDLCYALIDLKQVELFDALAKADIPNRSDFVKEHFESVRKIIMDYEEDLKNIHATRFDIEILTATIQEISFVLDQNIKEFDDQSKAMLHQIKEKSTVLLNQHGKTIRGIEEKSTAIMNHHERAVGNIRSWKTLTICLMGLMLALILGLIVLNVYLLQFSIR